jgi:hypothetical protein
MLFLHELHRIVGAREDDFEAHVRDGWMGALAKSGDARLAWHLKLAHGTNRAYFHVTITALRDGAAYEQLARRVADGDLRSWAAEADTMRHGVRGKVLLAAPWSPLTEIPLDDIPVDGGAHEPTLFMEDSAWPYEGKLDDYLDAARTHYAPSLDQRTERSLIELVAVFQAALGAPRRREVVLWQRVLFPERLPALFTHDLPAPVKGPGTWMHDALQVRDDWESRLLRTCVHSPLT